MSPISRRRFLGMAAGAAALPRAAHGLARPRPYPRAKRVVFIHLAGSPSNLDLFDHKPALQRYAGKPCPPSLVEGVRFAFQKADAKILPTPYAFAQHGESGAWMSELLPSMARVADKLTFIHSMHGEQFNHAPAQLLLHTGFMLPGRPSFGSWISYGLGSMNRDLPAFVVLVSGGHTPSAGKSVWGSGFLPSVHQGVQLRSKGAPVLFLDNPPAIDRQARRRQLDALGQLEALRLVEGRADAAAVEDRSEQYELAYRMQESIPEALDLRRESRETLDLYGAAPGARTFASHCLLARRLLERGVRFVQLYDWGWDGHGTNPKDDIVHQLPLKCRATDRPTTALILDLERRGLLDDTIVVWTGEFGRTPMNEERNGSKYLGRDHHPHCFTSIVAGGGFKPGLHHGATDELGFRVTENPVHIHDLQATLLHQLGIDHETLTFRHVGRDYRLTDVAGRVVTDLLA